MIDAVVPCDIFDYMAYIGVWSDQWGEFVKPPPSWDQFPSKTKVILKTVWLVLLFIAFLHYRTVKC